MQRSKNFPLKTHIFLIQFLRGVLNYGKGFSCDGILVVHPSRKPFDLYFRNEISPSIRSLWN